MRQHLWLFLLCIYNTDTFISNVSSEMDLYFYYILQLSYFECNIIHFWTMNIEYQIQYWNHWNIKYVRICIKLTWPKQCQLCVWHDKWVHLYTEHVTMSQKTGIFALIRSFSDPIIRFTKLRRNYKWFHLQHILNVVGSSLLNVVRYIDR